MKEGGGNCVRERSFRPRKEGGDGRLTEGEKFLVTGTHENESS